MKSWGRLVVAGLLAAGLPAVFLLVAVMACGPDFEPEVFVPEHHPEQPRLFADGHLGVLQNGYYHADLVVAYRYLSGGKLSDAEKESYTSQADSTPQGHGFGQGPAAVWRTARAAASGVATNDLDYNSYIKQDRVVETPRQGWVERDEQLNCPDAAFTTAIETLAQRTKQWGAQSTDMREWLRGQDAVFSNCSKPGTMPAPAQPSWSALLKQDRAYQIAAAKLYQLDFDGAKDDFLAIGKDQASPWSRWGEYLAARAEVRKAANTGKPADYGEMAIFNMDGLKAAQARLLKLQQETQDAEVRHAAAAELDFIEVRLDPEKRLDRVSAALSGPQPDREFQRDLTDLDFLMTRHITGDSDMVRWIETIQRTAGPERPNALDQWKKNQTLPWLVVALMNPEWNTSDNDMMAAAAKLTPDSPGYQSANDSRAARLMWAGKTQEARTLVTTMLAKLGPNDMASTKNELLGLRTITARNLPEFLADAPRTLVDATSSAASMARCSGISRANYCTAKIPPQQFDADAAGFFNTRMPLGMWEEAAQSPILPKNLRDAVAWAAWVRALGLGDAAAVKRMSALLPDSVRRTTGNSDGFPATLALLRAPGLRPYLEQGVQRSATYAKLDEYRDNWWSAGWTSDNNSEERALYGDPSNPYPKVDFLTAQQKKQAAVEATRLNALPIGPVWLGQRAIAYVKAHPDDKDAAEALALTVRATHLSGDSYQEPQKSAKSAVSKQAFEMLHRMYPKSPWALRTKYYY
jgi:hypothetical protein